MGGDILKVISLILQFAGSLFLFYWGKKLEREKYKRRALALFKSVEKQASDQSKIIQHELSQRGDDIPFDEIPTNPL